MPIVPNQIPEIPEEFHGYYLRYLAEPNGVWKYIVPEEKFTKEGKMYHRRLGAREKAQEIFTHIVITGMKDLQGGPVHEMHMVFGGVLKANGTSVDGGQIMQKAYHVGGKPKVENIWDPFPPPPKVDIPEPDEVTIAHAPSVRPGSIADRVLNDFEAAENERIERHIENQMNGGAPGVLPAESESEELISKLATEAVEHAEFESVEEAVEAANEAVVELPADAEIEVEVHDEVVEEQENDGRAD